MGIVYALASMFLKAFHDILYKKASDCDNENDSNVFYAIQGIACFIIAVIWFFIENTDCSVIINGKTLIYGAVIGVFSYVSYFLLLKGLVNGGGTVGIVLFRLSFIPASIWAILFLGEELTWNRALGIMLCSVAVFILVDIKKTFAGKIGRGLLIGLLSCFICSFLNTTNKFALIQGVDPLSIIVVRYALVSVLAVGYVFLNTIRNNTARNKKPALQVIKNITKRQMLFSFLTSILMLVSLFFGYYALLIADAMVVTPISQISFVFSAALCAVLFKEKLALNKITGLFIAVAGVIALAL